ENTAHHTVTESLHLVSTSTAAHWPSVVPHTLGVTPVIQRTELADRPGAHRSHHGTVVTGFADGPFGRDGHGSPGWVAGSGAVTDSPDCIVIHPVGEELTPTAVPGMPDTVKISGYGRESANAALPRCDRPPSEYVPLLLGRIRRGPCGTRCGPCGTQRGACGNRGSRGSWHADIAATRPPVARPPAVGAGTGARDRSVAARAGPYLAGGSVRSVGDERADQWDDGVSPRGGAEPVRMGPAGDAGFARLAPVGAAGGP